MKKLIFLLANLYFLNQVSPVAKNNALPEKEKKRKIDITVLREKFVHDIISLLELFENTISKVFFSNNFSDETKKKILNYFSWARLCIVSFEDDPFLFDRVRIEKESHIINECKVYLKNILEKENSNGRV
jgi:hypothetical protein